MSSSQILRQNKSAVGKPCDCLHYTESGPIAMLTCVRCLGTGLTDPQRDKTLKRNRERRIPTETEMLTFGGAHCNRLYGSIGPDWRCPGCHRTKYQLMRWTMLYPNRPDRHPGWAVGLHKHHDHGQRPSRFPETLVCEQCNNADTAAKRQLDLPQGYSFSPTEISRFVIGTPHGWHLINYLAAAQQYAASRQSAPHPPPLMFWPPEVPT